MPNVSTINGPPLAAYYFRMYPNDHLFLKGIIWTSIMEGAQVGFLTDSVYDNYITSKMPEKTPDVFTVPLGAAVAITITSVMDIRGKSHLSPHLSRSCVLDKVK
ncbi:hypothetical protein C0995_009066 [Termitomyces sp. Mi166|nr:hypothetical protein C0995_009066 [Termitomyces sp. Mi166\